MNSYYHTQLGIAAETLMEDDETDLEVYLPALNPFFEGEVKPNKEEVVQSIMNKDIDREEVISINTSDTIKCSYIGLPNRNRPTIHRGEIVEVIQYKSGQEYWWRTIGRTDDIRLEEHVVYRCCSKTTTSKGVDNDSSYYLEFDSRNGKKHITLSTALADGEGVKYHLTMDVEGHTCTLEDDAGNLIQIETDDSRVHMKNADKTHVDLLGPDLFIHAPRNIGISCGVAMSITAPTMYVTNTIGFSQYANLHYNAGVMFSNKFSSIFSEGIYSHKGTLYGADLQPKSCSIGATKLGGTSSTDPAEETPVSPTGSVGSSPPTTGIDTLGSGVVPGDVEGIADAPTELPEFDTPTADSTEADELATAAMAGQDGKLTISDIKNYVDGGDAAVTDAFEAADAADRAWNIAEHNRLEEDYIHRDTVERNWNEDEHARMTADYIARDGVEREWNESEHTRLTTEFTAADAAEHDWNVDRHDELSTAYESADQAEHSWNASEHADLRGTDTSSTAAMQSDINSLQNTISSLQSQVTSLQEQVDELQNNSV